MGDNNKVQIRTVNGIGESHGGPAGGACDDNGFQVQFFRPFYGKTGSIRCIFLSRFIEIIYGSGGKRHAYILISRHEKLCQIFVKAGKIRFTVMKTGIKVMPSSTGFACNKQDQI